MSVYELHSKWLAPRLVHQHVLTQRVWVFFVVHTSFSCSLSRAQQALFKCHRDVIHLPGLNTDCGPMQRSEFLRSYYNVISGFQLSDKGPFHSCGASPEFD